MILLTEYFVPAKDRCIKHAELLYCISENVSNPFIEKIVLFMNETDEFSNYSPKFIIVRSSERPTYKQLFDYSVKNYYDKVCCIANTDIVFNDTISILGNLPWEDRVLALGRHELVLGQYETARNSVSGNEISDINLHDVPYSQDAWIFHTQYVKVPEDAEFKLGIPGCDNRIALLLFLAGNKVYNPCKDIVIKHIHSEKSRNNKEVIPGPYLLIDPTDDCYKEPRYTFINDFDGYF